MARRRGRVLTKICHASWWDLDEEVTIRRFSWGHRQSLANRYVEVTATMEGDEPGVKTQMFLGNMNLAIVEAGVVSWTLKDEEGRVLPLDTETIYELPEEDGEFILGEINALNTRRSKEEQVSFRAGTDTGIRGQGALPAGGDRDPGDEVHALELAEPPGDT